MEIERYCSNDCNRLTRGEKLMGGVRGGVPSILYVVEIVEDFSFRFRVIQLRNIFMHRRWSNRNGIWLICVTACTRHKKAQTLFTTHLYYSSYFFATKKKKKCPVLWPAAHRPRRTSLKFDAVTTRNNHAARIEQNWLTFSICLFSRSVKRLARPSICG